MKITSTTPLFTNSPSKVKLAPELERALEKSKAQANEKTSFGDMLMDKMQGVEQMQQQADIKVSEVASGKGKNLHEAVLAMEMADTSLRLMVTVRNKALEAYQEIMRMPI